MKVVFKCSNPECQYAPCYVECRKASETNDFGDGYVETPDVCPFLGSSDCEAKFKYIECAYDAGYADYSGLMDWFSENYGCLPRELTDCIDHCAFYGEQAKVGYETIARFCNLMQYESTDEDRWSLKQRVGELCKKFTKAEILIAALHNGYEMGLLRAAKIMKEQDGKRKEENEQ